MKKKIIGEILYYITPLKILAPKVITLQQIIYNKGLIKDAERFLLIEPVIKKGILKKGIKTFFFHKMFSFLSNWHSSK